MTAKIIEVQGRPTSTVELKVEWATNCFETITFEKGVVVKVIAIVKNDDAEKALKRMISAVDDLECLLIADLDALDNWQGEISGLLAALDNARKIVGTQGE
jgi:hypothetical protein